MEIERKFLVAEVPELTGAESVAIEQGYLATPDGDGGAEVRLRRRGDSLLLTIKGGSGEVRSEVELELDRERFESLWPLTEGRRVSKTRYLIAHGELTIELDRYRGELGGLLTAEVEFADLEASRRFQPPAWFGADVTGKEVYSNQRLATVGAPIDTTYRLKRKESPEEGLRRVARGRLEQAVTRLRDEQAVPAEAVHGARKDLKKLRSTLRLVRPALGKKLYRRENRRYRDAARSLSDVRDAQVRAQTVDALAERFADEPPAGGWSALKAQLAHGATEPEGDLGSLREQAATAIAPGAVEIGDWPLGDDGFELLRPGLERAYARGRLALVEARDEPTDESLHEFRKRSKDLWYHLRLLRNGRKALLGTAADEAHELSDRLGDDHDLALLADSHEGADPITDQQRAHLARLISRRRGELQADAFALGERLYAEKPRRFAKRIEGYWESRRL